MRTTRRFLAVVALLLGGAAPAGVAQSGASDARDGFFWGVLDGAGQGAPGCAAFAARLERTLSRLPDEELERFAQGWAAWWDLSYRWDLWGAAYLINGGASDDGFDYFRGWLLTRGSRAWALAARDPDGAFDDVTPGTEAECEDVVVALPVAYEERFGREAPDAGAREPGGTRWTETDLPRLLPRLAKRFGTQE